MKNDILERLGPLQPGEIKDVVFDFAPHELEPDETIAEILEVVVSAYFGEDEDAGDMLDGAAQVVGRTVVQRVAMRLPGVTYLIRCTVRSNLGKRHSISAFVPCVKAA